MALGVLNNISAIYAQNNLSNTQASLSKTLQQLSSGSRINSGADDAAGLSLANGLQASSTALSQSAKNASEGVDFLQVADGALSQVTSLLNRAVTLATEASNGTLNGSQVGAANSEYQKILTEVDTINNNTEYNGINTFAKNAALSVGSAADTVDLTDSTSGAGAGTATVTYGTLSLTINGSAVGGTANAVASTGTPADYEIGTADTVTNISNAINEAFGTNVASVQGNQLVLSGGASMTTASGSSFAESFDPSQTAATSLTVGNASDVLTLGAALSVTTAGGKADALDVPWDGSATGGVAGNLSSLAAAINTAANADGVTATVSGNSLYISGGTIDLSGGVSESETANAKTNSTVNIFTSDGTISQSYNNNASDIIAASSSSLNLAGTSLTNTTGAQAALALINSAITTVAADRGTLGANINTLTAVGNVMTMQSTNTLAAENDVTATDYGQATSDMSKFQILSQTGIAALSQANQSQQLITKLLQ
jgi:flagellin